jgi:hypothetical protein
MHLILRRLINGCIKKVQRHVTAMPSAASPRCCRRAIVRRAICGQPPLLQARNGAARHLRPTPAAAGAQWCGASSAVRCAI